MNLITPKTPFLIIIFFYSLNAYSQMVDPDTQNWFNWDPTNTTEPGVIGMADWLEKPVGKHGVLKIEESGFAFEDGTPFKAWGINHSNRGCGPLKEEADKRAAWYAKMGVNAIRMHKFTYSTGGGYGNPESSTQLTEAGWDRLDYYWNQLRETGIYFGWSPVFRHYLVDGDSAKVLAYDEIKSKLRGNTIYLVNFAPDLQEIMFSLARHLLNHKNPYSGLRYADDPALIFYELQNEDNIFWLHPRMLERVPTYKKMFCEQYSEWLKKKYGSQEALEEAWGPHGMDMFSDYMTGESLEEGNIYPMAWFPNFSPENIEESNSPQRMLDNAAFLYETQLNYYRRFAKVIRETGYEGPLVGSCWQAGQGVIHYYNLHTDYEVGIIDRHNYFGPRPHRLDTGVVDNGSMLRFAGSGLLSSGLHASKGRPFVFSEWTSKMPNEWIAEGPAIVGIYGMGLQGWDGSYHFNGGNAGFSTSIAEPNVYNTNNVTQIGQFPSLARMIYRKDITEGALLPYRNVHIPSLGEGKIGFEESVRQQADIKQLGGDVPIEALALGRTELQFTDEFKETTLPDWKQWIADSVVTSNTGQLKWNYKEGAGYFTVNTEGTKAICGFTNRKTFELGDVTLLTSNPFAIIYLTSLEKNKSISESSRLLLTTIARARNTGMEYEYGDEVKLVKQGDGPVRVEPVNVTISFSDLQKGIVNVLDHDGLKKGKEIKFDKGTINLSGTETKTIWYEIVR